MRPTERFSSRVEDYIKYRPGYPGQVADLLSDELAIGSTSQVADIGCGPGQFTRVLLPLAETVFGVEPNQEMREAGVNLLKEFTNFRSVNGTAEATTLPDQSVDVVTAAQAFHWFDLGPTRREFQRILRPDGLVLLIWNERLVNTPFLQEYEQMLVSWLDSYQEVSHKHVASTEAIESFFGDGNVNIAEFPNQQVFDWSQFRGRMLSSSYVPQPGDPHHELFLAQALKKFNHWAIDGYVEFNYTTKAYWGRLA